MSGMQFSDLICTSQIAPKAVDWLWPDYLPLGKLSLAVGNPDSAKSLLITDIAARVSLGEPWPNAPDVPQQAGDVILLSAEDEPANTIIPRLTAHGANSDRIHILDAVQELDRDFARIADAVRKLPECRMVAIDPLSAYWGKINTYKNSEVRRVLKPLAELAAELNIAIIGVEHLRKSGGRAIFQPQGSIGIVGASRAAWAVVPDPDDPDRKLFVCIKNNLSGNRDGLSFRVEVVEVPIAGKCPRVAWEPGTVSLLAEDVLQRPPSRSKNIGWVKDVLSDGPMPARTVIEQGEAAGIPERTLQRAFSKLGGRSERKGFGGAVEWSLPDALTGVNGTNGENGKPHKRQSRRTRQQKKTTTKKRKPAKRKTAKTRRRGR